MKPALSSLIFFFLTIFALSSCAKENAYQDDANQQNSLETQQKVNQLNQVKGTYTGKMHLIQSDFDLPVQIYLDVSHTTASDSDQIDKLQIPALAGFLSFPALQNDGSLAAMSSFPDLVRAMGSTLTISFINGDYDVNNSQIYLPYNSGGMTSSSDQVIGTFHKGVFTGEWDNHSFGKMGTFSLERSGS